MPTPCQHVRRRAAGRKKAPASSKKPIDNVLALCYYDIDNTHKEAIFMKKDPFTPEELEEAAAELDEEAAEWVAYCTRCCGAIEVAHDRSRVDDAALIHALRHKEHQVIVGKEILGRSYAISIEP